MKKIKPEIIICGDYYKKGVAYKKELVLIKKEGKYNGKMLICKKRVNNRFYALKSDFATVRILRRKFKVPVLSVSAVVYYKNRLLLHKRSLNSDTFGGYFHIIGGNIEDENLVNAIKREIFEETSLHAVLKKGIYYNVERETGFIQFVFVAKGYGKIKENWEGSVYLFDKKQLPVPMTPSAKKILLHLNGPYCKEKNEHFAYIEFPLRLNFI